MSQALATVDRSDVLKLAEVDDIYLKQLYQLYFNPKTMGPEQEPTRGELVVFAQYCAANGMDPNAKDVYFIKDKKGKVHYQISIDGLRGRAEATGELDGILGPFWMGKDKQWVDYWVDDDPPLAAKVGILRKGCSQPFWGFARTASYRQSKEAWSNWGKMPEVMIAKCAASQGYRAAFPKPCARLYIPEEMSVEGHLVEDAELPKAPPARFASPVVTPEIAASVSVQAPPEQAPEPEAERQVEYDHKPEEDSGTDPYEEFFNECPASEPATEDEIQAAWTAWNSVYGRGPDSRDKLINEVGVKSLQRASKEDIGKIYTFLAAF